MAWTDERIEHLKSLWQAGLSASQIARQLGGVTRNAVIGKVYRLGLSGRSTPSAPRRLERRPRRAQPGRRVPPPPPRPRARVLPAAAERVDLAALASPDALCAHMCKWPIGDPKDPAFGFCGRDAGDRPYCPSHAAVAYQTGSRKRPGPDPPGLPLRLRDGAGGGHAVVHFVGGERPPPKRATCPLMVGGTVCSASASALTPPRSFCGHG